MKDGGGFTASPRISAVGQSHHPGVVEADPGGGGGLNHRPWAG